MNHIQCYVGTENNVHGKIAKNFNNEQFTPELVATYRSVYEATTGKKLLPDREDFSDDEVREASTKLSDFIVDQNRKVLNTINSRMSGTSWSKEIRGLKKNFSFNERYDRSSLIRLLFGTIVDQGVKKYGVTREEFIKGFEKDGKMVGGQYEIFNMIRARLIRDHMKFLMQGNTEAAQKVVKMLANWPAILNYARIKLRQTEAVSFSNNCEWVDATSFENFNENTIDDIGFNAESAHREHWHDTNELKSAYSSIGSMVRSLLGRCFEYDEEGNVVKDDLGYPKTKDPVSAHQEIQMLMRGVQNSKDMMDALVGADGEAIYSWLSDIVNYLDENNQLRTMFLVDFCKNFQVYSIITKNKEKGLMKTTVNRVSKQLFNKYFSNIAHGNIVDSEKTIFNSSGYIIWDKLAAFRNTVNTYFAIDGENIFDRASKTTVFDNMEDLDEKRAILIDTLAALGIDIDYDIAQALLNDRNSLRKLQKSLRSLVTFGIDSTLKNFHKSKNKDTAIEALEGNNGIKFNDTKLISLVTINDETSKNKEGAFREHITKILDIVGKNKEYVQFESSGKYFNSKGKYITYYSDINPCFMGDRVEKIKSFVVKNEKKKLRDFIEENYLKSEYFADPNSKDVSGRYTIIYNKWLEEIYNATFSEEDLEDNEFLKTFDYTRALGTGETVFEKYSDRMHMTDIITRFYNSVLGDTSGKAHTSAEYSVFVLGDSNASKYMSARVYQKEDIIKGLYNIFLQERARWKLQKAVEDKYGKEYVANFSDRTLEVENRGTANQKITGEFTFLSFLNPEFMSPDGGKGKYWNMIKDTLHDGSNKSRDDAMNAIRAYMQDAFKVFTKDLKKMGINKIEKGVYTHLPSIFRKENYDELMERFYYNHKFAMIQQLQMFTIDTAFYGIAVNKLTGKVIGTVKDLQKRYKQEHAPGRKLDIFAMDEDGIPYFMARDERTGEYVQSSTEKVKYFRDIEVNPENQNMDFMEAVSRFYPKGSAEYKAYMKTSLTDGQGYRTLRSLRKVMGGLGQWTTKMEEVYKEIQSLREAYWDKGMEIPEHLLASLEEKAVVFQPKKPILFGFERLPVGDTFIPVPVQHKYAEVVIIPELEKKGSKLRSMGEYMDREDIDMICSTKAVKVGTFGAADISNITDDASMKAAFDSAYTHKLDYNDWREQTNVPDHVQESRSVGTQMRKLLLQHITLEGGRGYEHYLKDSKGNPIAVNLGGKRGMRTLRNGRDLMAFYNSLISAGMDDSMQEFIEEISTKEKIADSMVQLILNNNRESEDNMLAVSLEEAIDGSGEMDFVFPLYEPSMEHSTAALIISRFKKKVNKQRINGNSSVQASALGLKGYEEDGDLKYVTEYEKDEHGNYIYDKEGNKVRNILYAECELGWDIVCNILGSGIELNYDDYVYSSSKELVEFIKNQDGKILTKKEIEEKTRKYGSLDKAIEAEGLVKEDKALIEHVLPGVLDMIAYRIPTEREYSMMRLKVKRFSRKMGGGTIKVPPASVTVAGFDFDIDKLYLVRKEFKSRKFTDKEISQIWASLYRDNPDIKDFLKMEQFIALTEEANASGAKLSQISDLNEAQDEDKKEKTRLYQFWEAAGLEGTPREAFRDYVLSHPKLWKYEEYDFKKTAKQNTKAARNNMFLHLALQRLADPETLKARITPGGFPTASNAARFFRELEFSDKDAITRNGVVNIEEVENRCKDRDLDPEPDFDPTDPMTLVRYTQQNQAAGNLIGIFANHNTNHAFSSLMYAFHLKESKAIAFAGHKYWDFKNPPVALDKNGHVQYNPDGSVKYIDVDRNMAEFLAASVDAVKDPVLNFLNLSTVTADVGATLVRLGYTMKEVGALLNQPIIRRLSAICAEKGVSADLGIADVWKELNKESKDVQYSAEMDFTMENLCQNILNQRFGENENGDIVDVEGQAKVLKLFEHILAVSGELSQFVQNTKFTAANSVSSTFGGLYASLQKVDNYVNNCKDTRKRSLVIQVMDPLGRTTEDTSASGKKFDRNRLPIDNDEALLDMDYEDYYDYTIDSPFAYEQYMYDAIRRMVRALCGKGEISVKNEEGKLERKKATAYFPYENRGYKTVRELVASMTKSGTLDEDLVNLIHYDYLTYIMATRPSSTFDGARGVKIDNVAEMPARQFYLNKFPQLFFDYLNEYKKRNGIELMEYLSPKFSKREKGKIEGINLLSIGNIQGPMADRIKDAWENLHSINPVLSRGLFMYSFHKLGFSFSFNTFMHLAPVAVREDIKVILDDNNAVSYSGFLKQVLNEEEGAVNNTEFIKQLILNHPYIKKLVLNADVSTAAKSAIEESINENALAYGRTVDLETTVPRSITIKQGSKTGMFFIKAEKANTFHTKDWYIFRPAFLYKGVLYIADGDVVNDGRDGEGRFNCSSTPSIVYNAYSPLGIKGKRKEYGNEDIEFNNPEFDRKTMNLDDAFSFNNIPNTIVESMYKKDSRD